METNPYQAPAEDSLNQDETAASTGNGETQHLRSVFVIGLVSHIVAIFVTPADPISMFVAAVPIFLFALAVYFVGFRKGRRVGEQSSQPIGQADAAD